jgi:hypothetical protein
LPGPTAGLRANLDWLKQNEPSIDLVSRAFVLPQPVGQKFKKGRFFDIDRTDCGLL